MDVIQRIKAFDAGRNAELLQVKYASMRESGFAFFRGTAHLFHERLGRDRLTRSAPRVWTCGDLHLENFGGYGAANGLAHFDITDFDQAALAPANWELVRMLASIHVGGDQFEMKRAKARRLCEESSCRPMHPRWPAARPTGSSARSPRAWCARCSTGCARKPTASWSTNTPRCAAASACCGSTRTRRCP